MRKISLFSALFLGVLGCGKTVDRDPFYLQIQATNINTNSFQKVQIEIEPRLPDESFALMDTQRYFNGAVETRVTGRSLLITISGSYFLAADLDQSSGGLRVNFPMYALTDEPTPSGGEPKVKVDFIDGNNSSVAHGEAYVPWPLPDGELSPPVAVTCIDTTSSCTLQ